MGQTDVFLLCFSVVNPQSKNNIQTKWFPEINHHANGVPFILVGTKLDLRTDENYINKLAQKNQKPVTTGEGQELAQSLQAQTYIECSALTQDGLKQVFDEAIRVVINFKKAPSK